MFMVAFDFNAEQPMKLTQIGNLDMLQNSGFKISNQGDQSCHNHTVINMDQYDDHSPFSTLKKDGLINIAASKT